MSTNTPISFRPFDDCRAVPLAVGPRSNSAASRFSVADLTGSCEVDLRSHRATFPEVLANASSSTVETASSIANSTGPTRQWTQQEVVEQHTAARPSTRLATDYVLQSGRTGGALFLADTFVAIAIFWVASAIATTVHWPMVEFVLSRQFAIWWLAQTAILMAHHAYPGAGMSGVAELRACVRTGVFCGLAVAAVNFVWGTLSSIEMILLPMLSLAHCILLPTVRYAARRWLSKTSWWGVRILLLGSQKQTSGLCKRLQKTRQTGYVPVGYVCHLQDFLVFRDRDDQLLGPGYDARSIAARMRSPVAVIASPEASHLADRLLLQFPSLMWLDRTSNRHSIDDPIGSFEHHRRGSLLSLRSRFVKRSFDVIAVSLGLVVLSPVLLLIAAAIKWQCPGPIFYASDRIGQHGKRFSMWKFRTMVTNADAALQQHLENDPDARREYEADQKLRHDPRIIAGIGHFLRRTSLDEIPQLWNVLVGQMSLVGPRPMLSGELTKYNDQYFQYSHMWPGITGLWQVSGRNDTDFETRVFLVNRYASHWSLWLDAWILIKTPLIVLTGRGAC